MCTFKYLNIFSILSNALKKCYGAELMIYFKTIFQKRNLVMGGPDVMHKSLLYQILRKIEKFIVRNCYCEQIIY